MREEPPMDSDILECGALAMVLRGMLCFQNRWRVAGLNKVLPGFVLPGCTGKAAHATLDPGP